MCCIVCIGLAAVKAVHTRPAKTAASIDLRIFPNHSDAVCVPLLSVIDNLFYANAGVELISATNARANKCRYYRWR